MWSYIRDPPIFWNKTSDDTGVLGCWISFVESVSHSWVIHNLCTLFISTLSFLKTVRSSVSIPLIHNDPSSGTESPVFSNSFLLVMDWDLLLRNIASLKRQWSSQVRLQPFQNKMSLRGKPSREFGTSGYNLFFSVSFFSNVTN